MSKNSAAGNPDTIFQFLKEILSMTVLDKENEILGFNSFPTSVETGTKIVKCHYLFHLLGVNVIYVRDKKGFVVGEITRERLLSLRYQLPSATLLQIKRQ
jgi:hypothetical protein